MVDRLRVLLDRPLDPRTGRAIVVLATAITVGFAVLVALAATQGRSLSTPVIDQVPDQTHATSPSDAAAAPVEVPPTRARRGRHRQDPQDDPQSAAGRRAKSALQTHQALQHVPYRRGRLHIQLVGAHSGRAVLLVTAPTLGAAHKGWQRFLGRYSDSGDGYLPRFRVADGRPGLGVTGEEG